MKGPQGQSNYFDSPIMGIGMQSGQTQVMQPGEEYFFPQDEAVYERKMQYGGLFPVGPYDEMMAPKQGKYLLPDINRPSYIDDEGGRRSEYRTGINIDGKETLIPTVVGGRQLSDDETLTQFERTGLHMGQYDTVEKAEAASKMRTAKYNMLEDPIRFKMQLGAITKPEKMTLEQQARFNAYMAENSNSTIQTPEWLNLSSGATRFARRFNNMGTEELSRMPGDISKDVTSAFERGLDYSIDGDLGSLGRFSTDGNYNPFGTNTLESLYSGISYENNSPNLGVRINPKQQELTLRGKGKQLKLKRDATDEETISELAFSLSPIGQALNVYGRGTFEGLGDFPKVNRKKPYLLEGINPEYNIQAGVRGEVGPLNYNVRGNYNPETGYRYNADAELSLLKNRLNLRGDVSGSKEAGLQSLSAEARARLAKGLSVKAGYSKSKDQPGSYNVGFSYTKAFQGGGMSIPRVQGTVVAAPTTLREAYKKKKKK